jgi:hypothetical protein
MPISSLLLVHNGDNPAVRHLKAQAPPRTHVAALAPHVAGAVRRQLGVDADWAMAVLPFVPKVGAPRCRGVGRRLAPWGLCGLDGAVPWGTPNR